MKRLALFTIVAMAATAPLFAASLTATDRFAYEYPLDLDGTLMLDNPFGNIEIVGADAPTVVVNVIMVTRGVDKQAVAEGRGQTKIQTRGDQKLRELRTVIPEPPRSPRWQSLVSYFVRAPRNAHIKVTSTYADRIRIAEMTRDVSVKSFAGDVVLDNIRCPVFVEVINGSIIYHPVGRPVGNSTLSTVNGRIQVDVPADATFQWIADTIQGDYKTTLPLQHGRFIGRSFRALVNQGAPSATLTTSSLMGDVYLLKSGTSPTQAQSVRQQIVTASNNQIEKKHFVASVFNGDLTFVTNIGDISVGAVHGDAKIQTAAGQVQLQHVDGECNVLSHGGELELGDIVGLLNARTDAGNVTINSARAGGTVTTGGGIIRVLSTGGPTTLKSGGGDIVVRQAGGPIAASTLSGDVTITFAAPRTEPVEARTSRGNVVLNVVPSFGADVDATIITSDPDTNSIESDFNGLTIRRESVGHRTRIHATGKVNGGGQHVVLYAEEGDIRIVQQSAVPTQ